jgi:hypothetical protein
MLLLFDETRVYLMDIDVDVKGFRTFARDRSAKTRKSSNSERRCSVEFIERSCPCGGAAISKVVRAVERKWPLLLHWAAKKNKAVYRATKIDDSSPRAAQSAGKR